MSDESVQISVLSNKAIDLLKRLDESYEKLDEPPILNSSAQTVDSREYKNQITWIVKKTNLNKTRNGYCLKSPIVEINFLNIRKLWLEVYPKEDSSHADLKIGFCNLPENIHIQCNISLKDTNQQDVWEDIYSGSSVDLKGKKLEFNNLFLGIDRRNDSSVEETLQVECRLKLFSTVYKCIALQNYTVDETPKIKNYMEDILNSGKFSDVDLEVESANIKSHKCILASESPSLRVLFKVNYGKKLALPYEKSAIFQDVLSYVYTGDIRINNLQHAWDLYVTANKYELHNLKNLCSAYLNANLTESNISDVFDLSREHDDKYLMKACIEFIKKHDIDLSTELFMKNRFRQSK